MQGYDYFHKCLPSCHLQQQKCVFVIITNLCILLWPTSWLATDVWHCYKPKTKADCRGSTNIAHSWLIFHSDWVYSAKISHFKKTLKLKSGMVKLWLFGSFWGQNPYLEVKWNPWIMSLLLYLHFFSVSIGIPCLCAELNAWKID